MTDTDPLRALVIDEADLTREELGRALGPLVRVTDDGQLRPEPAFDALNALRKVACVLLTFRAQHFLGIRPTAVGTPSEIETVSGIPGGTVRPKLSELLKRRLVHRVDAGYEVPLHAMRRVVELIEGS